MTFGKFFYLRRALGSLGIWAADNRSKLLHVVVGLLLERELDPGWSPIVCSRSPDSSILYQSADGFLTFGLHLSETRSQPIALGRHSLCWINHLALIQGKGMAHS